MGQGIFISYRRADAGAYARLVHERLAARFGADDVFMDVDSIPPAEDFVERIGEAVRASGVLVALIGKGWLTATDPNGRRLDDPEDFVRIELELALREKVPIVPVLLDDATMPRTSDLPADLQPLVRRQAQRLRHETFSADFDQLVRGVQRVLLGAGPARVRTPPSARGGRSRAPRVRWGSAVVVMLILAGIGGVLWQRRVWRSVRIQAAGAPDARPPELLPDMRSRWEGTWRHAARDRLASDGTMEIVVAPDGVVAGTYSRSQNGDLSDGRLEGRVVGEGRVLEGRWSNKEGQAGAFLFRMSEDGQTFRGSYSIGDAAAGDNLANVWQGTRAQPTPGVDTKSAERFSLLIQCYPSTVQVAERARGIARELGVRVPEVATLRQDQLIPRTSEIIYYSEPSRQRSLALQARLKEELGLDVPVTQSPYFGDPGSTHKLRLNLF